MTVSIDSLLRSFPRDVGRSPIRKSDILKVWQKEPAPSSQHDVNTRIALFGGCGVMSRTVATEREPRMGMMTLTLTTSVLPPLTLSDSVLIRPRR